MPADGNDVCLWGSSRSRRYTVKPSRLTHCGPRLHAYGFERGNERDSTPELLRHEIMDDVQPEPGTALRTSCGEERIENVTLNFLRNTAAVIRESDLDLFHAEATRIDQHVSARPGEAVSDGVEDEVGQHLPVSARIAVQGDVGGHLERE